MKKVLFRVNSKCFSLEINRVNSSRGWGSVDPPPPLPHASPSHTPTHKRHPDPPTPPTDTDTPPAPFDSRFHFRGKFWINFGYRINPKYSHLLLFIYFLIRRVITIIWSNRTMSFLIALHEQLSVYNFKLFGLHARVFPPAKRMSRTRAYKAARLLLKWHAIYNCIQQTSCLPLSVIEFNLFSFFFFFFFFLQNLSSACHWVLHPGNICIIVGFRHMHPAPLFIVKKKFCTCVCACVREGERERKCVR